MQLTGEDYTITYTPESATVTFEGSLRLQGIAEYAPISNLLNELVGQNIPLITLNLTKLKFLNSSGINILSRFVIALRKQGSSQLIIRGSSAYPWQAKSLKNLERLMKGLRLEIE